MKITEVNTKEYGDVLQVVCKDLKDEMKALVTLPRFIACRQGAGEERICYFGIEKHEVPSVFDDSDYLYN